MPYTLRRPLTIEERNQIGGGSDTLAHLLFHRGITEAEVAGEFLIPDYDSGVYDPFLLKHAEKAADRIIAALKNNEKIVLYSDYDADGIPGAVMFNDFFRRINYANASIYIPHRHNEGFGVHVAAVDTLAEQGTQLIITLDCGISDVGPVAYAVGRGIDVIITDHHEPPEKMPDAYAIVDHKQTGCEYPDKNICGTGVGYKLIQAIIKKAKLSGYDLGLKEGHEKWFLDMVGIATLSDMVPLVGENRIFARYGLSVLRKSPRKGLIRLLNKLKIAQQHLTEDDIAFMITPRINAASRMGVPRDAFNLLIAETDDEAREYADHLDEINTERKGIVAGLVKEVKKILRERYGNKSQIMPSKLQITNSKLQKSTNDQDSNLQSPISSLPAAIVLGNPDWRPSLLGLVANTCAKEYQRPVFLWGKDGQGAFKGSCRSEGTSSVVDIMRAVPDGVFTHAGGHKFSGGFEVHPDQVFFVEKHLNDAALMLKEKGAAALKAIRDKKLEETGEFESEVVAEDAIGGGHAVDAELKLDEVNWRLQEEIERLAPFGTGNPKPLFIFKKVSPSDVRIFGKTKNHVELVFVRNFGMNPPLSAISFFGIEEPWAKELKAGQTIDLIATIEKSMFRGRKELRLRVVGVEM
jgi:single-stranded-DNA-specific exonuclease